MFLTLLIVTFIIAISVCFIIVKIFHKSLTSILNRLIEESISGAWLRYLKFAIYVVGISSGVRIWHLEKYITPADPEKRSLDFGSISYSNWNPARHCLAIVSFLYFRINRLCNCSFGRI